MKNFPSSFAVAALILSISSINQPALAQSEPTPATGAGATTGALEEIIVTAQKRESSAQSVPQQVVAVPGSVLVEQGITNIQSMSAFAPNLQLGAEQSSTQVFIRGIGQNFDAASDDPGSSIYIDQVYTPRQATTGSMFDVSRLEVLPGPQGTLYGRNAAGGALNIITNIPTNQFEAGAMLETGNYDDQHFFGMINVPVNDILKIRAAVDSHQHDGYLSSGQDDLKAQGARISALLTPNDALSILLRAEYTHNHGNGDGVVDNPAINPKDPWYAPVVPGSDFFSRRTISKLNGEINYHFGEFTLTYIPAYEYFTIHDSEPIGSPVDYFPNPNDPGTLTGFSANLLRTGDNGKQITNELRLSRENDSYHWVAGLYQLYYHTYTGGAQFQIPQGPGPFAVISNDGPYQVNEDSYAAFGEGTYSVTPVFRLTLGGRLSKDYKSGDGSPSLTIGGAPFCPPSCSTPFTADNQWTHFDWKAGFQADVAAQSMLYGTVQTGYIEGGFSTVPNTGETNTFKPETLTAFTVGIKNRLFENRLQINDEVFYYNYRDLQVTAVSLTTGASIFYNAPKSRIYGNDLDVKYLITDKTEIGINLGLLNARFVDATLPPATVYACGPGIPASVPCNVNGGAPTPSLVNYSGESLSNSPPVSGSAYLTHTWPFIGGSTLAGRVSTHYEAANWGLYSHLAGLEKPAYTKTDVTLTYRPPSDKYSVALWAKNLENSAVFVTPAASSVYGLNPAYIEPPRTYGVRLTVGF
jgi:iron complex outermembrane receptor protein